MTPRRDMLTQMAALWLAEERKTTDSWDTVPFADAVEIARDRVQRIYDGEVKRSEASPGDKAVWNGRPRCLDLYAKYRSEAESREAQDEEVNQFFRKGPRLHGYRERQWWNFYDTVRIERADINVPGQGQSWMGASYSAFAAPEIGNQLRTNMTTMGMAGHGDQTFIIVNVYCVPLAPVHEVPWGEMTGDLVIGMKPQFPPLPLAELFLGGTLEKPLVIPVRQHFQMRLTSHAKHDPFEVVCHVEGLLSRDVA